ncbi:MAG TPA: ABC transporter substrate binding protein [Clostridia bacterium]|nr:ABC transporter substrate binding protein [Clostridia bacterium]
MDHKSIINKYKSLFIFFTGIIICIAIHMDAYASNNVSKNVLILNSYQKGLSWTDDETTGIIDILEKSNLNLQLSIEYMDWKNYPQQENLRLLYSYFKYKYKYKKIDVIITTDDAALKFALKNRSEIFSNAPVVFCGVTEKGVQEITRGYSNVTGIIEEVDAKKTIKTALKINSKLEKVYVIYDNTESGYSMGNMTIDVIRKVHPYLKVIPLHQGTSDEILNKVGMISRNSIILITTYYNYTTEKAAGFENFCQAVSDKSRVPVYSLHDFGINHGVIGGSMLSGKLQGNAAGKSAERILNGENISTIPISFAKTTRYMFDYKQLKKFNIPISQVPKGSIIVNKPFSFFETYKNLVITVLFIFILLLIFIFILLFYLNKISNMKKALYESNIQLTSLYDDLSASEEELRSQYYELAQTEKSLAASEKLYKLIFQKMLNGFAIIEPVWINNKLTDFRYININPGHEKHTERKTEELLGKTWHEAFGFPNKNLVIYEEILKTGESKHFETYYPSINTYFLVSAFKINDERVGIVVDNITEYKQAIKDVRSLNEELEMRVEQRTNELKDAIKELEAFAYTVSHDIKAPLRAVDGYCKIFLEDFSQKLDHEAVQMILGIRGICKDMIEMVSKLLQYSTTSRSPLNIEELNTEDMIKSIFDEIKSSNTERSIKLKIETGLPRIKADKTLFRQVIYNILSNAVKFTQTRENAIVIVGSTITENEYVFYIKDNGVGFNMNYVHKLFGLFQRLHTSDEYEGSGIGLVTVKKVIEKHGGRVWIEGNLDVGACIYFTFPLAW